MLPFASKVEKDSGEKLVSAAALANQLISKISKSPAVDCDVVAARKASVKAWLESNHLQVTEEGGCEDLVIQGCVRLCPPYSKDDCIATNEIILSRVVELISDQQRCSE